MEIIKRKTVPAKSRDRFMGENPLRLKHKTLHYLSAELTDENLELTC